MYINELRLSNIRSYRTGQSPVALKFGEKNKTPAGLTVLAGKNGSGKTTILRAIALALSGPSVARSLMPSFTGWLSEGEQVAKAQVSYSLGPDDFFREKGPGYARAMWAGLSWMRTDEGAQPKLVTSLPPKAPSTAPLRGPWAENPRGWFLAGYGPFRRLSGAGMEAQRLMLGNPRTAALATLFDETASLAEATWWLQEIYPRVLEKDERYVQLQKNVFKMLNDGLLPDGAQIVDYNSDGLWVTQGNTRLLLEELSDGYRVAAALVLDIVRRAFQAFGRFELSESEEGTVFCPHQGVVLIDELDVHLHVSWQQRIGFWLREHFPQVQFIVSTHSPFICQAATPGSLVRLPAPGEEDRTPRLLPKEEEQRIVNGGSDDAVMSDLFGLDSVFAPPARAKRERLAELEASGQTDVAEARSLADDLMLSPSSEVAHSLEVLMKQLRENA